MSPLVLQVKSAIVQHQLLAPNASVLVAVSGGLDSTVLLRVLHQLAPEFGWRVTAGHFNHQLRGRSSDADERFVRTLAKELGVRCVVGRANVRRHAARHKLSVEMAARELRHGFLAKTAARLGIGTIALGHHANDQVELYFLRTFRGTSAEGLRGMTRKSRSPAAREIWLIRPLLEATRQELEAFAKEERFRFREDASNRDFEHARNRVRHKLLPYIRARFQPAIERTVARLMTILGDESDFITDCALQLEVDQAPFDKVHPAIQRRWIALRCLRAGIRADMDLIERLRLRPQEKVMVAPDLMVWRDAAGQVHTSERERLQNRTEERIIDATRPGEAQFGGLSLRWKICPWRKAAELPLRPVPGLERFDADLVGERITLRHWKAGDRFQPIGMATPIKLQDFLTNLKIPRETRRALVLAETRTGPASIFWIEGLRISDRFKMTGATRRCLEWRWERQVVGALTRDNA